MSEIPKTTKDGGKKETKTEIDIPNLEVPSISYLKYAPILVGIGIAAYAAYYLISEFAPGMMP